MARTPVRYLPLLALFAASLGVLVGCDNECSFRARCNGNVLERCGDGVDQIVHRRIRSQPCAAPNDVCVQVGHDASCVLPARVACDATLVRRCGPGGVVRCGPVGLEEVERCDPAVSRCRVHPGGAVCVTLGEPK